MKTITLYIQDPFALKHWMGLEGYKLKLCYDLNLLVVQQPKADALILVHLTDDEKQLKDIEALCQLDCHVICLSNTPSAEEGANLFKKGIKGYLNTFARYTNITQALEVVQSGNVWLGQLVMNAMITSLPTDNLASMAWKDGLTEREIATAELLLKGNNNKEIASELDITERTVKSYIHKLFEKLGAKDRLGLVLKIQNWGRENT